MAQQNISQRLKNSRKNSQASQEDQPSTVELHKGHKMILIIVSTTISKNLPHKRDAFRCAIVEAYKFLFLRGRFQFWMWNLSIWKSCGGSSITAKRITFKQTNLSIMKDKAANMMWQSWNRWQYRRENVVSYSGQKTIDIFAVFPEQVRFPISHHPLSQFPPLPGRKPKILLTKKKSTRD